MSNETTIDATFATKVEDLLQEKGWGQKWYYSPDVDEYDNDAQYHTFCLMGGALWVADELLNQQYSFSDTRSRWAEFLGFETDDLLYQWNDTEGRTVEEVLELIRQAKERQVTAKERQ